MMEIRKLILESLAVKSAMAEDEALQSAISKTVDMIVAAFQNGNKVLFCGNGGSAADAQHIAAELSGRFYLDRPGLYAEALHCNTSYLTAVANDYDFDIVYARLVEAMGKPGDVLIAISTSGNSTNLLKAVEAADQLGVQTIAMTGSGGGKIAALADIAIRVPSDRTPRIQEGHILIGHIICELVEKAIFSV